MRTNHTLRIAFALAALMTCMPLQAQQSLWDFGSFKSPEFNSNGSVTVRLVAPWAQDVSIAGDFFTDGRWEAPMAKDAAGVWHYTTEPLESGLYTYRIIVDGVVTRDTQNTYTMRDVFNIMNYFIVPGARGDLYSVQDVPHGTVSRNWYSSSTLNQQRRLSIYTPPGYEKGDRRYPVLYLLHGMGGDEEAWLCTGRAEEILDNMIAAKRCPPMIVVMTNGNALHKSAPGESDEGMYGPYMSGSYDTSFESHFKDVVNYVDRTYRTVSKPSGRAIAGLSMGGWQAFQIGLNYPWLFDSVGLFSAALGKECGNGELKHPSIYDNTDSKLDNYFENDHKKLYIAIGKDDSLYGVNRELREKLDAKGYGYRYLETTGGHDWRNWRIYLEDYLTIIFK